MSDTKPTRDRGVTLPELLIVITVIGLIATVLSASIIVTLKQEDNIEGRFNVARAEQNVSTWIPADLASADDVIKDPEASPCPPSTTCGGVDLSDGSNVLMLSWSEVVSVSVAGDGTRTEVVHTTNVSYNFFPLGDGTYGLRRTECNDTGSGWNCTTHVVLKELPGPPGGEAFVPGVGTGSACIDPPNGHPDYANPDEIYGAEPCTVPDWVILVSFPLTPEATSDDPEFADTSETGKNANRVIVTVTGGGDADDAGGGVNQISITAGGTVRRTLDANGLDGVPSFVEARSRCGGPLTLIVDESKSISIAGASSKVVNGVRTFVETLVGTPVQIQIIEFEGQAKALGTSDWQRYFDMSDTTTGGEADQILAAIDSSLKVDDAGGDTNWEDALYRTFFTPEGATPQVMPETVVFFTDGVPTSDRQMGASYRAWDADIPSSPWWDRPPWPGYSPGQYNQVAFNRAQEIAAHFRVQLDEQIRWIGVGVGGINDWVTWIDDPGTPYSTRTDFERQPDTGGTWTDISPETYSNRTAGDGYNYRINGYRSWYGTTEDMYNDLRPTLPYPYYSNYGYGAYWRYSTSNPFGSDTHSIQGKTLLANLVAGDDNGIPAEPITNPTNVEIANMYVLGNDSAAWDALDDALKSVALGECGGTLTLSTKFASSGASVGDPVTYEKSAVYGPTAGSPANTGTEVETPPTTATTNLQFATRTFDFTIDGDSYITVEIQPQIDDGLDAYSYAGWECRAGINSKSAHTFDVLNEDGSDTGWDGMRVDIGPNEAVACKMLVNS